jgi:hypothetical protein
MASKGKKVIILSQDHAQGCWIATFDDVETLKLFGTLHIPTAFTLKTSPEDVLEKIQKLNPDRLVVLNANVKTAQNSQLSTGEKVA